MRIDLAARGQNQPRRNELLLQPVAAILPGHRADRLLATEHRPTDRLSPERGFEQVIVDQIVGRIGRFAQLRHDDLFLALEMLRLEMRSADKIRDQLGDQRQVAGQCAAMEHRLVAAGPGIERSSDVLDHLGQRARVAPAGALKHHMLDEVCETAEPPRFRARANACIEAKRNRLRARQRIGRDGETVGQDVPLTAQLDLVFRRLRTANP